MTTTRTSTSALTRTGGDDPTLRWLARAGIVGPVLFTATFLAQQWARRDTYDWVAEPVSNLEAGPHGWVQQANFVVFGVLMAAFAVGMARAMAPGRASGVAPGRAPGTAQGVAGGRPGGVGGWLPRVGPALLGLSSAGLFLAAVFPLEQDGHGVVYDPGLHFVAGVTFFLSSGLALLALSRGLAGDARFGRLPRYALVAGLLAFAGFVVMGAFVIPDGAPLHPYAGVAQRVVIVTVTFPCLVVLAARLHRVAASDH